MGGHSWFITCCLYCIAGKRGHLTCITLQRLGRKGGNTTRSTGWAGNSITHPWQGLWVLALSSMPALGQHWAEMPFYKSREPPKPSNWERSVNRCIAGDKIIPPPGIPTFPTWQTQQIAALHLSSSTYQFLSPAHLNSKSLGNIGLHSSEARGVRMLAGNCSQLLSCSWVAQ